LRLPRPLLSFPPVFFTVNLVDGRCPPPPPLWNFVFFSVPGDDMCPHIFLPDSTTYDPARFSFPLPLPSGTPVFFFQVGDVTKYPPPISSRPIDFFASFFLPEPFFSPLFCLSTDTKHPLSAPLFSSVPPDRQFLPWSRARQLRNCCSSLLLSRAIMNVHLFSLSEIPSPPSVNGYFGFGVGPAGFHPSVPLGS